MNNFVKGEGGGVAGGGAEDALSPMYCLRALLNFSFPNDDMSLPEDSILGQALSMPLSDQDARVFDVVELIEGYLTNPLVSSMGKSNDVRQSRMF